MAAVLAINLQFCTTFDTEFSPRTIIKLALWTFHRLAPPIRCEEGGKSLIIRAAQMGMSEFSVRAGAFQVYDHNHNRLPMKGQVMRF